MARRSILLRLSCVLVLLAGIILILTIAHRANAVSLQSLSDCLTGTKEEQCFQTKIDALLKRYSTRQLMDYISASSSPEQIQLDCHPIGHIVGEETYKETGNLETALSMCPENCRGACLHGALGAGVLSTLGTLYEDQDIAHASDKQIRAIGSQYCARSMALCHGIGHILYLIDGDGPQALQTCAAISSGFSTEACYQGIFMERAGTTESLTPFTDTKPAMRAGDYGYPCLSLSADYRHACFQFLPVYQAMLYGDESTTTIVARLSISLRTCESLTGKDRASCFEGVGVSSGPVFGYTLDTPQLEALCGTLPELTDREACTLGVLPRFMFYNKYGTDYCGAIKESPREKICYDAAFEWAESNGADQSYICGTDSACNAQYAQYDQQRFSLPDYRFGLYGK